MTMPEDFAVMCDRWLEGVVRYVRLREGDPDALVRELHPGHPPEVYRLVILVASEVARADGLFIAARERGTLPPAWRPDE